jgi:hypothetical protein
MIERRKKENGNMGEYGNRKNKGKTGRKSNLEGESEETLRKDDDNLH